MRNFYIKSLRISYFFLINIIAHLALIPAILYGELWMWILSLVWSYWINVTAHVAGYHRYYCHKSFKAPRWYDYYYQFIALFTNPGPVGLWSGIHRLHHKYSDTKADPHSPKLMGFWYVWFGTVFFQGEVGLFKRLLPSKQYKMLSLPRDELKVWFKEMKDPTTKWFYDNHLLLVGIIMGALLLIHPLLFVFGFCIPTLSTHYASAVVNTYTHRTGESLNEDWLAFYLAGDGYHLNHHEDPSNYTTLPESHKWWQFDITGLFIKLIKI